MRPARHLANCSLPAVRQWNEWKRQPLGSSHWVQLELLADLGRRARDALTRGASQPAMHGTVWSPGLPFWDTSALSAQLVPDDVASFVTTLLSEFARFDAYYARLHGDLCTDASAVAARVEQELLSGPADDGSRVEWEREARELVTRAQHLAQCAHAHRVAALWLLSGYAMCALDVLAPLVSLEALQFWSTPLSAPLEAATRVLHMGHAKKGSGGKPDDKRKEQMRSSPLPGDATMQSKSPSSAPVGLPPPTPQADTPKAAKKGGKDGKEKKGDKKDKGAKAGGKKDKDKDKDKGTPSRNVSLPDALAGPQPAPTAAPRKPTHILTAWVRPSLEWQGRAQLVGTGKVLPVLADQGVLNTRIHLDGPKWTRYKHAVKALDASLVTPSEEHSSQVTLHWDGAGTTVRVRLTHADGNVSEDTVSARAADEVLRAGAMEDVSGAVRKLVADKHMGPKLRVSSQRSVYAYKGAVTVTWDANIVVSECVVPAVPVVASFGMSVWQQQTAPHFVFPYHVVTVTTFDCAVPSKLARLLKEPCFTPAPGYDEYITGVALLRADVAPRPHWIPDLTRSWKADWLAVFDARNARALPPWANEGITAKSNDNHHHHPNHSSSSSSGDRQKRAAAVPRKQKEDEDEEDSLVSINDDDDLTYFDREKALRTKQTVTERTPLIADSPVASSSYQQWDGLFRRRDAGGTSPAQPEQPGGPDIRDNARQDPKTYWANERTLLSWLGVAIFLAISAVQLLTFGDRVPQIAGTVMGPVAMIVSVYALARFHLRNVAISNGGSMRESGIIDWWGPWLLIPLFCCALLLLIVVSFVFGSARVV